MTVPSISSLNGPVYCISYSRTPVGSYLGSLSSQSAVDLGVATVKALLQKCDGVVKKDDVQEIFFGNVVQAGSGQHPARQVARLAGLRDSTTATTVNKVCASGLKAINLAYESILLGHSDVVIAGGTESMSNTPFLVPRSLPKFGSTQLVDSLERDGLGDAYSSAKMGDFAEETVQEYGLTRDMQDDFTLTTYRRAKGAQESGVFKDEIDPVIIKGKKGDTVVDTDEEPSKLIESKVKTLRPAFNPSGTITAASSSPLSDGAASVMLVSSNYLQSTILPRLGSKPLTIFELVANADAAKDPPHFTVAPTPAIQKAMERAAVAMEDVDLFEINEAFGAVALANMKNLGADPEKVNVHGGAVAMGHPLGCSGARIFVTLCNALKHRSGKVGVAGICNGGGGATATVIRAVDISQVANKL